MIQNKMENLTTLQKFKMLSEVECKSKTTINRYKVFIEEYIDMYGEKPDQEQIIHYLFYLRTKRNYDKSSLCVAKSAIIYYYKEVLGEEITVKLPIIKKRKSLPKPLPKDIIKKIIQNLKNLKHRLLVEITYDGGFRPREAVKLKWGDIDWDLDVII